ncbi:hypothetical protein FRC14_005741 [Serendipita sp. 396]|nr:hypothetical protein FRC14_005741 [Serendipita sp. 396]
MIVDTSVSSLPLSCRKAFWDVGANAQVDVSFVFTQIFNKPQAVVCLETLLDEKFCIGEQDIHVQGNAPAKLIGLHSFHRKDDGKILMNSIKAPSPPVGMSSSLTTPRAAAVEEDGPVPLSRRS